MSQLEYAKNRLFSTEALNVVNIKLFPGSVRDTTSEQFAEEINKSLSQIEAGNFETVSFD